MNRISSWKNYLFLLTQLLWLIFIANGIYSANNINSEMKNKYIRFLLGRISTYIHKSPNEFVLKVGIKLIFATSNLNIEQIHSRSSFELNKLVFQIYFLSFHYQTMKLIFIFAPLLILQPSILIRSEYIFFSGQIIVVYVYIS